MTIPIVGQAVLDTALPDVSVRVLLVLCEHLDPWDYRPVKHEVLSHLIKRKRQTIAFALRELEAQQYLRAGVDDPDAPEHARSLRPKWYRLLWSRELPAHRPPWSGLVTP